MQGLEKIPKEMQKIKEIMLSPANVDCFGDGSVRKADTEEPRKIYRHQKRHGFTWQIMF